MRASRILAMRPERPIVALAQLCEERKNEELLHASPSRPAFPPARQSNLPPQTPYTVGSSPMRPVPDRLSPPQVHEAPSSIEQQSTIGLPPDQLDQLDHMAPKRAKWTSPPPPEAPAAAHSEFEGKIGEMLALATAASNAREQEKDPDTSSTISSEVATDDEDRRSDMAESVDDVRSTRSYSEDGVVHFNRPAHGQVAAVPTQATTSFVQDPSSSKGTSFPVTVVDPRLHSRLRGRPHRLAQQTPETYANNMKEKQNFNTYIPVVSPRLDHARRSLSGPPRTTAHRYSIPLPGTAHAAMAAFISNAQAAVATPHWNNIYYETSPIRDRFTRNIEHSAPNPARTYFVPPGFRLPAGDQVVEGELDHLSASSSRSQSPYTLPDLTGVATNGGREAMSSFQQQRHRATPSASTASSPRDPSYPPHTRLHSHSHSHSTATVTASTTPPPVMTPSANLFSHHLNGGSHHRRLSSNSSSPTRSTSRSPTSLQDAPLTARDFQRSSSPFASVSSESGSPAMSFTSSQYAASVSPLSTSPPSPTASDAMAKHLAPTIPEEEDDEEGVLPPASVPQHQTTATSIPLVKSPKDEMPPGSPVIAVVVNPTPEDELVGSTETLTIDT